MARDAKLNLFLSAAACLITASLLLIVLLGIWPGVIGESEWTHTTSNTGDRDNSGFLGSAALVIALLIPILVATAAYSLYRLIRPHKPRGPSPN